MSSTWTYYTALINTNNANKLFILPFEIQNNTDIFRKKVDSENVTEDFVNYTTKM